MSASTSTASTDNSKANEARREEFRKYLEHGGAIEAIANVLLSLYMKFLSREKNEKPENPLEFLRKFFAEESTKESKTTSEIEKLKKELSEAKAKIKDLKKKLNKNEANNASAK